MNKLMRLLRNKPDVVPEKEEEFWLRIEELHMHLDENPRCMTDDEAELMITSLVSQLRSLRLLDKAQEYLSTVKDHGDRMGQAHGIECFLKHLGVLFTDVEYDDELNPLNPEE